MGNTCTVTDLRYVAGTSNKFYRGYTVETSNGCYAAFQWGRRGTEGQSRVDSAPSLAAAKRIVDSKLRAKRNKGYVQAVDFVTFDPGTLPPQVDLVPRLDRHYQAIQRLQAAPALKLFDDAVTNAASDPATLNSFVVLERFDLESCSEFVAAHIAASLDRLPHGRGKVGLAVALPFPAAQALRPVYSSRTWHVKPPCPIDSGYLDIVMGLWDPAAPGPLSTLEGAAEAAGTIYA